LKWLYTHCALFVCLSLDEGFGLPVVEAATLGCRVLASDIPVFRETIGCHATFVDALDVDGISRAIRDIVGQQPTPAAAEYRRTDADATFVQGLARLGGPDFASSAQFVGVTLYPDTWAPGSGRPYDDMVGALASARASVDSLPELRPVPLEVLETGAPLLDEAQQAAWLRDFVRATLDARERLNVTHLSWFDLWDSDSGSPSFWAHYGLLRSDLSLKPAFEAYRDLIAGG